MQKNDEKDEKDEPKVRWFDFTLHTYNTEDMCETHGKRLFDLLKRIAEAAVFSLEKGEEKGRLHFQGRLRVSGKNNKGRKTLNQVISAFRDPKERLIYWDEDQRGAPLQFKASITSKLCVGKWDYVLKDATHVSGPWYVNITPDQVLSDVVDDFEFPQEVVDEFQEDQPNHQYMWDHPRTFQRQILDAVMDTSIRQINIIRDDGIDSRGRQNPTWPKGGHAGKSEWGLYLGDRFYTGFPDGVPAKDDIAGIRNVQPIVIYIDGIQTQKLLWEQTFYEIRLRRVKKNQPRITLILDCTRNTEQGGWSNNEWKDVMKFAESVRNGKFREPRNNWKEFRTAKVKVWIFGNDLPPINLSEGKFKEYRLRECRNDSDELDYKLDAVRHAPQ